MNKKYIRPFEGGLEIRIIRLKKVHSIKLSFRTCGGREKTILEAIRKRNELYLALFNHPISNRFAHIKKRKKSNAKIDGIDIELPPGLSLGYSRGKLLYIVLSISTEKGKVSRIRWNIKKLGINESILLAKNYREQHLSSIFNNNKDIIK